AFLMRRRDHSMVRRIVTDGAADDCPIGFPPRYRTRDRNTCCDSTSIVGPTRYRLRVMRRMLRYPQRTGRIESEEATMTGIMRDAAQPAARAFFQTECL
ncbi:TPA: hypothetical protein ACXM9F_007252, partial [Burkholderia cenocepacia]